MARMAVLLFFAGCGASVYPYRVMNDGCSCEVFRSTDETAGVVYSFSAVYSINGSMKTRISVSIQNDNPDTLDLSVAHVKISSRNVPYRYNSRFLPVMIHHVPPGEERTLTLEGEVEDLKQPDPWLQIAGEELTVTLKGMRINGVQTVTQVVRFVPHNPKLSS
ncbi:MAG: hypothetical protein HW407_2217 [Bacteroidetes bacterium]|nr:hypothetical protein [Bacteroidota bacterium]